MVGGAAALAAIATATAFLLPGGDDGSPGPGRSTSAAEEPTPPRTASPSQTAQASPSGGSGASAKVPADFAGTWTGTVTQTGGLASGESSTRVTIKLAEGATDGTSDYDDWGCHDTLKIQSASATSLRFQETPKKGSQGFCIGGTLTLKKAEDGLEYTSPGVSAPPRRAPSAAPADPRPAGARDERHSTAPLITE